ncbi:hypothetical protein ACTXT7_008515 [Hymenolepis weldensis]
MVQDNNRIKRAKTLRIQILRKDCQTLAIKEHQKISVVLYDLKRFTRPSMNENTDNGECQNNFLLRDIPAIKTLNSWNDDHGQEGAELYTYDFHKKSAELALHMSWLGGGVLKRASSYIRENLSSTTPLKCAVAKISALREFRANMVECEAANYT